VYPLISVWVIGCLLLLMASAFLGGLVAQTSSQDSPASSGSKSAGG
jgi:hypothetical protein